MITRREIRHLSHAQCEFLVEHIDTVRPIKQNAHEPITRRIMIQHGYIRYEPSNAVTPKGTVLTALGREAVCVVCDMWLEALLKIHYAEQFNIGYGPLTDENVHAIRRRINPRAVARKDAAQGAAPDTKNRK